MKLTISPGQLEKIMGKIEAMNSKAHTFPFKWRIDLLNEYKVKVAKMMGSVSGRGGYPSIEFTGESASGSGFYWPELAHIPNLKNKDYETKSVIWVDSGKTRDSFTVVDNWVGVSSEYAGLVERGGLNDQGFTLPARPLFSFANFMVERLVKQACSNANSRLGKNMRRGFIDLAESCGWGQ